VKALLAVVLALTWFGWHVPPNGSHDGRLHTCGYVTDDGVTDHLAAYWTRCGYQPDRGA
jgi:hypothetical protein